MRAGDSVGALSQKSCNEKPPSTPRSLQRRFLDDAIAADEAQPSTPRSLQRRFLDDAIAADAAEPPTPRDDPGRNSAGSGARGVTTESAPARRSRFPSLRSPTTPTAPAATRAPRFAAAVQPPSGNGAVAKIRSERLPRPAVPVAVSSPPSGVPLPTAANSAPKKAPGEDDEVDEWGDAATKATLSNLFASLAAEEEALEDDPLVVA